MFLCFYTCANDTICAQHVYIHIYVHHRIYIYIYIYILVEPVEIELIEIIELIEANQSKRLWFRNQTPQQGPPPHKTFGTTTTVAEAAHAAVNRSMRGFVPVMMNDMMNVRVNVMINVMTNIHIYIYIYVYIYIYIYSI